ncbi:MAG: TonB C-terminal domain-containing protein [Rubrivivax sp.]|nr:TonB C-terminal domain-containing protein [Rubrivivax sp.]
MATPASPMRRNLTRGVLVLLLAALVGGLAWWLQGLGGQQAGPKRQVAKISILPDQPPPPPPPPKEDKPPPPKEEPKQVVREEQIKPAEPAPANEPLKMEGAAGDGPSAFAAGAVRNEYAGGAPVVGAAASAGGGRDRAQERLYVNSARQLLRDALEKNFKSDIDEATAEFSLWIQGDGAIRRAELRPSGDGQLDRELQSALDETSRSLRLPPPPLRLGGGEPLRFRLTVKPQAG